MSLQTAAGIDRVEIRPGVSPTRLILGCAQLGNLYRAITDQEALDTVDEAWRLGVRSLRHRPVLWLRPVGTTPWKCPAPPTPETNTFC